MPYHYNAYGLLIESTIELPAFVPAVTDLSMPAINIICGSVPPTLKDLPTEHNEYLSFNDHEFKFEMPAIARYYICNGELIIIEPLSNNWREILLYFYSNCMASVLFQRNLIPFHVSGVFINDTKVLLFAAPSQTGKSTTSILLQQKGYAPFTDDTAVINVENEKCYAQASYPMIRVWQNTINNQTLLPETEKEYLWSDNEVDKFSYFFHEKFISKKVEIAGIVFLEKLGEQIQIESLKPTQSIQFLGQNIYRGLWLRAMNKGKLQFEVLTKIANKIPAYRAIRPENTPSFDVFAEAIENQIIKKILSEKL
jgi:hypothetical protein